MRFRSRELDPPFDNCDMPKCRRDGIYRMYLTVRRHTQTRDLCDPHLDDVRSQLLTAAMETGVPVRDNLAEGRTGGAA